MEKKTFNISVPIDSHRDRIDKFLQSQLSELSRTRLQNLIRNGHVKLNNAIINEVSKKIKNDDKIEVNFPQPKETLIKPNKIPLDILYDDDDLIIINKPPGQVVHPGAGNYEKT
ncbi:MAG: RNA pseudouridine synthase, partial [Pelagibacterales bacterium]|nr:RNA pseudouridine synthase [Pelagibacterales bacterium]